METQRPRPFGHAYSLHVLPVPALVAAVLLLALSALSAPQALAGSFAWRDTFGAPPAVDPLQNPWHVDVSRAAKQGIVYVSDPAAGTVRAFTTAGESLPLATIGRRGGNEFRGGQPEGIAVDGSGRVYVGAGSILHQFGPAAFYGNRIDLRRSHALLEWTDGRRAYGEGPSMEGVPGLDSRFGRLLDVDAQTFGAGGPVDRVGVADWDRGWFYIYGTARLDGRASLGRVWTQPMTVPDRCTVHPRVSDSGRLEFRWSDDDVPDSNWICAQRGLATIAQTHDGTIVYAGRPVDTHPFCNATQGILHEYGGHRPPPAGPGGPAIYEHLGASYWTDWGGDCQPRQRASQAELWDMDVDRFGNVYKVYTMAHQVVKVSPTGEFIGMWGERGIGPGRFQFPTGVAVDHATGDVYVVDRGNRRVQRFGTQGPNLPPCRREQGPNARNCSVPGGAPGMRGDPGAAEPTSS